MPSKFSSIQSYRCVTHHEHCAIGFNQLCDCHVEKIQRLRECLKETLEFVENYPVEHMEAFTGMLERNTELRQSIESVLRL